MLTERKPTWPGPVPGFPRPIFGGTARTAVIREVPTVPTIPTNRGGEFIPAPLTKYIPGRSGQITPAGDPGAAAPGGGPLVRKGEPWPQRVHHQAERLSTVHFLSKNCLVFFNINVPKFPHGGTSRHAAKANPDPARPQGAWEGQRLQPDRPANRPAATDRTGPCLHTVRFPGPWVALQRGHGFAAIGAGSSQLAAMAALMAASSVTPWVMRLPVFRTESTPATGFT